MKTNRWKTRIIMLLAAVVMALGLIPGAMATAHAAGTDPTTIFAKDKQGSWVVKKDTYGVVDSVTLSDVETESFEWSGNTCEVVLDSSTASDATVKLTTTMSGYFVRYCYMKYNTSAKQGANTSFDLQLSDGAGTVTLMPYYSRESNAGTVKTINITTAEELGEITGISITTPPNKTEYYATQTFDPTGMVVTATYDSGETRTIKNSNLEFSPSVIQNETTAVTVSYEGFTATQPVTVTQLPKSVAMVDFTTSNGSVDMVAIQNADGSELEEVTGIAIDGSNITVSLSRTINKTAQVKAVFTLTQNESGLPFLSSSNAFNQGQGSRTNTYTATLSNGNGTATAYLYNAVPKATANNYTTFKVIYATENTAPNRKPSMPASVNETVVAESPFTLDLSGVFEDPENDELTYKVSVDGASAVAAEEQYSYLSDHEGSHTLVFSAVDEYNATSAETYTVNLTVERKSGTHYITHTNGTGYTTEAAEGSSSPVNEGDSYTVKLNLTKGYQRGADFAVKANGVALAEDSDGSNTFTISNITADQEVTVEGVVEQKPVIIAPAGSLITLGTGPGSSYYKYSFIAPVSTERLPDGRVMNTYNTQSNSNLFYRVQNPNGVTYWNYFATKLNLGDRIEVTPEQLHMGDDTFNSDTVYHAFEYNSLDLADIYLNINERNYLSMAAGGTYELNSFRNWFAINSFTNDKVALPDMHYEVVDINGNPSDLVTITPNVNNSCVANVKAGNETGMALIKITYDAMYFEQGYASGYGAGGYDPKRFSAIWPDATGIIVVTVGADGSGINLGMTINEGKTAGKAAGTKLDAEHDPLFYVGDEGAEYTFSPEEGTTVTVARPTVGKRSLNYSGFSSEGVSTDDDGNVTITGLINGRNIVKVEKGGVANYQIITARKVNLTIKDSDGQEVEADHQFTPGETLTVSMSNVTSPGEKLSGYYNNSFSLAYYGEDDPSTKLGDAVNHQYGQYDFSSVIHSFSVTIPEDWDQDTYKLINGAINVGGFSGGAFGSHRSCTYAVGKGMTYGTAGSGILGRLPEITLNVRQETQQHIHNMTKHEAKAATCTAAGNEEYYSCDQCEKFFSDEAGETEIDENSWVIAVDPSAHSWGDPGYEWAADNRSVTATRVCAHNSAHKETETANTSAQEKTPATCSSKGVHTYTATFENEAFSVDPKDVDDIPIDVNAHKWGEFTEAEASTCVRKGQKVRVCEYNEEHKDYEDLDLLDHQLTKTDRAEATCSKEGNIEFWTCSECQQYFSDENGQTVIEEKDTKIPVDSNAHKWNDGEVTTPPSCTSEGVKTFTCEYDKTHTRNEPVDKVPHTIVEVGAKAANCTDDGCNAHYKCEVCSTLFADENGENTIAAADVKIPATGHKWGSWKVTKKATEKAQGEETRTCERDPSHKQTRAIPKLKPAAKPRTQPTKKPAAKPKTKPAAKTGGALIATARAKGKTKMKISWTKVEGAAGYDIFLARCNRVKDEHPSKLVKTIKGNDTFRWTKKGLKKGKTYKTYVKAFVMKDGRKTYVAKSPIAHAFAGGSTKNYTNAKKVTLKKKKVTLAKGETYTVKAKVRKLKKGKKLFPKKYTPRLRYLSSDPKVATVTRSGKVTAKAKGTCKIYALTHNGVFKTVTVSVR